MNTKLVTGIAVVALALGAYGAIFSPTKTVVQNMPTVSAVSSPIIQSEYFGFGGIVQYAYNQTMKTGTTTVCAIQAPVATSTLVRSTALATVSSTTASTVTFAKATTAFATTTVLATTSVPANAQFSLLAATTTPVADTAAGRLTITDRVFAPNAWLNVSMEGGAGTFSPTGNCTAVFQVLP